MNCKTAQAYINREIDGELTGDQQAALQKHLTECMSCRAVRQQLMSLCTALRDLATISQDVVPTLHESAGIQIDFGSSKAAVWRTCFSIAAAIAVLLLGVWAWSAFLNPDGIAPESLQWVNRTGVEQPVSAKVSKDQPTERLQTRIVKYDPHSRVRVRCKPESDVIVVPVKTQNPNVTIFWVYPTYKTAARPLDRPDDMPSSSLRSQSWSAI